MKCWLFAFRSVADRVVDTFFPGDDVVELAFDQLFADRGYMVDVELAFKMVAFVLDYAGQES